MLFDRSIHLLIAEHRSRPSPKNVDRRKTTSRKASLTSKDAEYPLAHSSTPKTHSSEESHALPELRPPDAVSRYADGIDHHQDEAYVGRGILQPLPRQPLICEPALRPAVETLHHCPQPLVHSPHPSRTFHARAIVVLGDPIFFFPIKDQEVGAPNKSRAQHDGGGHLPVEGSGRGEGPPLTWGFGRSASRNISNLPDYALPYPPMFRKLSHEFVYVENKRTKY